MWIIYKNNWIDVITYSRFIIKHIKPKKEDNAIYRLTSTAVGWFNRNGLTQVFRIVNNLLLVACIEPTILKIDFTI